ncbi:MAG TPA: LacI family DNA-binding transcriptional regulator [Candidatus Limnocylindrales bacterium]|nr:LacI family DNA-binding transcriptional regulator [Candidatus Limnocylindrales bacterium]
MERRRHRPRIADVAREAGVSKTAVSFAFNSPERLSAETAGRIREVAGALGYRPNPVARMLTQRQTMTLGVLTPQALAVIFSNPFFALFSEGVAHAAEDLGYELHFISPLHGSLALAVGRSTVDGVVAIGLSADHPEVEQIRGAGVPMVLVDSDDLPEHSSVVVDDEAGARTAAEHLLELGHREVVVMAVEGPEQSREDDNGTRDSTKAAASRTASVPRRPGYADSRGNADFRGSADFPGTAELAGHAEGVTARRLRGYRAAFTAAGADIPADRVVAGRASIDGGASAFHRAWALGLRPTAVLAMSDAMAIGVMSAARELGLRIPDDLSVVGFDDIDLAAHVDPPLTTVHQPIRQKGADAVRLLLAEVEQREANRPEHLRLDTRLMVRGSTGPAPRERQEVPGAN